MPFVPVPIVPIVPYRSQSCCAHRARAFCVHIFPNRAQETFDKTFMKIENRVLCIVFCWAVSLLSDLFFLSWIIANDIYEK